MSYFVRHLVKPRIPTVAESQAACLGELLGDQFENHTAYLEQLRKDFFELLELERDARAKKELDDIRGRAQVLVAQTVAVVEASRKERGADGAHSNTKNA